MNFCAFDLEIVKNLPEGASDWREHRPLGVSCAATWLSGNEVPNLWYPGFQKEEIRSNSLPWLWNPKKGAMDTGEVQELVQYLLYQQKSGYIVTTWNGIGFDFDVLAEESGMDAECKELARNHIDMMFHLFCVKGYPLGLQAASEGQDLPGKTEGMSGAKAPVMWAGSLAERRKVLEYVAGDALQTLGVAEVCQKQGFLGWKARSGRYNRLNLDSGWLTVAQTAKLPEPDNSWMSEPILRSHFLDWLDTPDEPPF